MSLFVGNITPRVRPHQLERVFQRFGRSKLELKDGYGFVVFQSVRDAENALQALRGRKILGEQLSIMWSKKQRPLKRFYGNSYPRRNYSRRDQYQIRGKGPQRYSESAREFANNVEHEHEGTKRNAFPTKKYNGDKHQRDRTSENDCHYLSEPLVEEKADVPLENDRWGEPLSEASNGNVEGDDAIDLHRYNPFHENYEQGSRPNKGCQNEESDDSYARNSSPRRSLKHMSRDEKFHKARNRYYNPSQGGHFKQRYPSRMGSPRSTKFNRSKVFTGSNGKVSSMTNPSNRIQETRNSSSNAPTTEIVGKGEDFQSTDNLDKDTNIRDHSYSLSKKRRSSREVSGNSTELTSGEGKSRRKKKRRSNSSSSQSPRRGKSRSYSPDSEARQHSHHTGSTSQASPSGVADDSHSESEGPVKNSRSLSTPRSLSVSLSPAFHRTVSAAQLEPERRVQDLITRQSSKYFDSREATQGLTEDEKLLNEKSSVNVEEGLTLHVKAENDLRVRIIQDNKKENCVSKANENENISVTRNSDKADNSSMHKECHRVENVGGGREEMGVNKDCKENSADLVPVQNPANLSAEPQLVNLCMSQGEAGNRATRARIGERRATNISLQEIKMILEDSGEKESLRNEPSLETYFGAARFWPWEIVYYRRMKRGTVTTENYANRLSQNEIFHIVDKYVRSSSGWWENDQSE